MSIWSKTNRLYYQKNKDAISLKRKEYYLKNKIRLIEKEKQRYKDNREKLLEYNKINNKKYYSNHKEYIALKFQNRSSELISKLAFRASIHRAKKLERTPKWLSKEQKKSIQQFYINCQLGYEVDHIIPLKGKYMSGLHVPWNLRIITSFENKSRPKNIKPFIGNEPNE